MGGGDPGPGEGRHPGGYSRDDIEGNPLCLQDLGLLPSPSEDVGIAALQTDDSLARLCESDQQGATPEKDPAKRPKLPRRFLLAALDETSDDSGWANLGAFGSYLNNVQPDFDPRTYGFRKLSDLVRSRPDLFVTEERRTRSGQPLLYLRAK